jgi:hypothetical protein
MLADRLRLPVQRCMAETSASDFRDWQVYQEQQLNTHDKLDYYLSAIIAEIRRGWVKNPKSIKDDGFLIEFTRKTDKSEAPATEDEKQKYLAESKAFFAALLKMPPRKPPTKKPVATKKKEKANGRPNKRTGNPFNPVSR